MLSRLVLTTPALAIALGAGAMGILLDRWGRVPVLTLALILFAFAGAHGLWAEDLHQLIAARFLFGLGVAGVMTGAATLLADLYRGEDLRRMVGLQAALLGCWGIVSQLLAGWLAEYHWRGPFALYLVALLLGLTLPWAPRTEVAPALGVPQEAGPSMHFALIMQVLMLALLSSVGMSLFSLILVHGPLYFSQAAGIGPRGTAFLISSMTAASSLASLSLALWKRRMRGVSWVGYGSWFGFDRFASSHARSLAGSRTSRPSDWHDRALYPRLDSPIGSSETPGTDAGCSDQHQLHRAISHSVLGSCVA
jgi:MFS family permease